MGDLENRLIAAATPKFFKGVSDAVAKELVEYWWLKKNGCMEFNQSGRGFEWRVRTRRGTPIGFSGSEGLNFSARNDFDVASLGYRGIADGIMLSWQELQEAKGEQAIFNLMDEVLGNLEADLLDALAADFYGDGTGRNSKTIHGLQASISASATYAGISQSTTAAWQAQVVSGAGYGNDPTGKLLDLKIACAKGEKGGKSRNRINIYLMTSTDWETLMKHLQVQQRFIRDEEMAKAGFENALVWGIPATWSEYADANTIYGLNSKLWKFRATTAEIFQNFNEWTVGLPKAYLGVGVSHFNLVNTNPRGSGKLTSTNT